MRSGARSAALTLAVVATAACTPSAGGPPRLVLDQSACARCSMLISEPAFAAAYRLAGRELLFDDLGCLLAALADEEDPAAARARARVWVVDFETGRWLAAEEAVFVRSPALHAPMGGGLAALRDLPAAERLAARTGGRTVSRFADLTEDSADAG